MSNMPTLESIKVVKAKFLPESARIKNGFSEEDFVEIRLERVNPASVNLVKLEESPGKKFSNLLITSNF